MFIRSLKGGEKKKKRTVRRLKLIAKNKEKIFVKVLPLPGDGRVLSDIGGHLVETDGVGGGMGCERQKKTQLFLIIFF